MIEEAYRLGLKVYAVDTDECESLETDLAAYVQCRDTFMAARIQALFDAQQCDKAVSLNGSSHVTKVDPAHVPLAYRFFVSSEKQPKTAFRLNFMFSTLEPLEGVYDPRWKWLDIQSLTSQLKDSRELCQSSPPPIAEDYAFLHNTLRDPNVPYLWIGSVPVGTWKDFDATIVIGQ